MVPRLTEDKLGILYVGSLNYGQTSLQRLHGLEELGHRIIALNVRTPNARKRSQRLLSRILHKLMLPMDHEKINQRIKACCAINEIALLWIDKGLTVRPSTLKHIKKLIPGVKIFSYYPDDLFNKGFDNKSLWFWRSIPLYDLHFVPRECNVAEFYKAGARKVYRGWFSYDPATHYPMTLTAQEKLKYGGPVGFIGAYEPERAEYIKALADASIPVRVWSDDQEWVKLMHRSPYLKIEPQGLWGDEYRMAINSFDIALGFVCRKNRDLHTTRSFEIPACQVLLVAIRTVDHSALFIEDQEAVFFDGRDELISKVRYYLANPDAARKIAQQGYLRCLNSGYDHKSRSQKILNMLNE